ncbi:ADP-ribosylation/crystallin J1 [Glycomyces sp. NPDC047010]|uniref:ADP-ribosylation/crystallin J1 n=1 Tax=Glycomyces sp. NPDC047010 TaxID=3155023 RepID=UPI003405C8C6
MTETMTLWRPCGPAELALVRESGFTAWPPRLPDQPIFYPILNEEHAVKIARDGVGYVTRFDVDKEYAERYPVQHVGGSTILELWVPAEELAEFDGHIVGLNSSRSPPRPDPWMTRSPWHAVP